MENAHKIILLGLGGQGVLFAGKVLAHAAFLKGYQSTFIPTYGPEVQNGPVKAEVVISREEICNPFIAQADIILVYHKFRFQESKTLIKNIPQEKSAAIPPKGIIFCKDFRVETSPGYDTVAVGTEAIASSLNNPQTNNIIMLGALAGFTDLFDDKAVGEALKYLLSHRHFNLVSLNFKAYKQGKELFQVAKQQHV